MSVYGLKNCHAQTYRNKHDNNVTTELTTNSTWLILLNYVHYHIKKAFDLTFQHLPLNALDSKENMEETRELSQMILRDGKHYSFL